MNVLLEKVEKDSGRIIYESSSSSMVTTGSSSWILSKLFKIDDLCLSVGISIIEFVLYLSHVNEEECDAIEALVLHLIYYCEISL